LKGARLIIVDSFISDNVKDIQRITKEIIIRYLVKDSLMMPNQFDNNALQNPNNIKVGIEKPRK